MEGGLNVLVYGSFTGSGSDVERLGMFQDRLRRHGIEMKAWTEFNDYSISVPPEYASRLPDAIRHGVARVEWTPIEWADVIVFRGWYGVAPCCEDCDTTAAAEALADHCRATGHRPNVPDQLLPLLLTTIEAHPEKLHGRAIVYDIDEDLLAAPAWLGFHRRLQPDRSVIEALLRRADLVTAATPLLARMAGRYNDEVRTIRAAVDPAWLSLPGGAGGSPAGDEAGEPRIVCGTRAEGPRADEICRASVDWLATVPRSRQGWAGANDSRRLVRIEEIRDGRGPQTRAAVLAAAKPDVGLAPVGPDDYSRSRSELPWLEYSLAGAATLAARVPGGGPYDVIHDGIDGLLAQSKAEWRDALRRLASSRMLRDELVGRARERVLNEYDADARAEEWSQAYGWAAEHGGRGALPRRQLAAGWAPSLAVRTADEAIPSLAHRRRVRRDAVEAVRRLAEARAGRDVCWPAGADDHPLVSITIPTYNRGRMLVERALASALAQTYDNIEVVVVGDCATAETVEAIASVADPRLRFENLAVRGPRPPEPERAWLTSGSRPYNRTLDLARGQWIAPTADDDELTCDHVEVLLREAIERRLEFVYGATWMEQPDSTWFRLGHWPPELAGFGAGAVLYSSGLRFLRYDEECWREDEPNDWNLWRRIMEAGARMGYVDRVVFRHYAEARHRPQAAGATTAGRARAALP